MDNLADPNVNLEEVNALNHSRSIAFVNNFVSRTAEFLNRYAAKQEDNLAAQTQEMQKLEIALNLIEEKLSSIPYLKDFKPSGDVEAAKKEQTTTAPQQASASTTENAGENNNNNNQAVDQPKQAENTEPVQEVAVEDNSPKVKDDPRYQKFFKMLNFGVPRQAVMNKMTAEGLNASLLDTPDAPLPSGDTAGGDVSDDDNSVASGSTADEFSD